MMTHDKPGSQEPNIFNQNPQFTADAIYQSDLVPPVEGNVLSKPSDRPASKPNIRPIGVIFPLISHASAFERLRGVMSVVAEHEYYVKFFHVRTIAQGKKILQMAFHEGHIDGLLIFAIDPTEAHVHFIHRKNLPTVLVEAYHPQLHSLNLNEAAAIQTAIQYLIDLGHFKIAYIEENVFNPWSLPKNRRRYQGYCQALTEAGLSLNPNYHRQPRNRYESGRQAVLDLLKLPDPPTAIYADSNELALDVLNVAHQLGLQVPGNLSVIGYCDTEVSRFARLTTVRPYHFEAGAQGVELLLNAINQSNLPLTQLSLSNELIVRQTTGVPEL